MRDDFNNVTDHVGYRKPPKHSQFKKGESGNLKGRPRGSLNLATVLERTLREQIVTNQNGRRTVITKLEAAVKELVNQAAAGDARAMRHLSQLVISAEQRSVVVEPVTELSETDQKVMENVLKRFQQSVNGGNDETHTE
jgi:replication-associated recombination protein RarA